MLLKSKTRIYFPFFFYRGCLFKVLFLISVYDLANFLIKIFIFDCRYDQILAHHLKDNCWEKAVSTCRRFGVSDRSLWIKLLHESIVNPETPSYCLVESLNAVGESYISLLLFFFARVRLEKNFWVYPRVAQFTLF